MSTPGAPGTSGSETPLAATAAPITKPRGYRRFGRLDRIQHLAMLTSFLVLAATGLPQKFIYANIPVLDSLIDFMGGIDRIRIVHRIAATLLMVVTVFHALDVAYRLIVRRAAPATRTCSTRSGPCASTWAWPRRAPGWTATPGRRRSSTGRSSGGRSS